MQIREDIPSRLLQCKSQCNIESLTVEINLRKRKWFLNCSYNPHRDSISSHLECLNRVIDEHSKIYDNFIFIGDFNVGIDKNSIKHFCDITCLKSLTKVSPCLKKPWQTHMYRPSTHKSAQSIPTMQSFWTRSFRLPSFNSNWIQNGISKTKTEDNCLPRLWTFR